MKLKALILFLLMAPAAIFLFQGCDKCKETGTIEFDAAKQFFEVTYLVDSNGANYATTVWNPNHVEVMFSRDGADGPFAPLADDLSDGKVGPFPYSTSPYLAQKGAAYEYWYIVTKDTFGTDSFRIVFNPSVDECHEYWGNIEYFKDGQLISTCIDKESCSIEIRE